ncbi:MAG: hypothetical protein DUD31_11765 [Coriobacteriaceae bacterium]|jgi:uncharacterized protein YaaQ|nr:MAG: hypothetical protein DUD31_11765 [Coriobacteriaceae bacterium]
MRLIIVIVQNKDANKLRSAFVDNKIPATRFSSNGGFLRSGNATYFLAVKDNQFELTLKLIRENSSARDQYVNPPINFRGDPSGQSFPTMDRVGGATIIILPIEKFYQF